MGWLTVARGVLKGIPTWVWYLFAAALAYRLVVGWYDGQIDAADRAGYERAKAEDKAVAEKIIKRAREIESVGAAINQDIGEHLAKDTGDIRAAAGDLRLRPAPRVHSVCPAGPAVPGVPGAAAGGDAASGPVDGQLAEVPWIRLIGHAESCDLDRAKLRSFQEWWVRQADAFKKMAAQ